MAAPTLLTQTLIIIVGGSSSGSYLLSSSSSSSSSSFFSFYFHSRFYIQIKSLVRLRCAAYVRVPPRLCFYMKRTTRHEGADKRSPYSAEEESIRFRAYMWVGGWVLVTLRCEAQMVMIWSGVHVFVIFALFPRPTYD